MKDLLYLIPAADRNAAGPAEAPRGPPRDPLRVADGRRSRRQRHRREDPGRPLPRGHRRVPARAACRPTARASSCPASRRSTTARSTLIADASVNWYRRLQLRVPRPRCSGGRSARCASRPFSSTASASSTRARSSSGRWRASSGACSSCSSEHPAVGPGAGHRPRGDRSGRALRRDRARVLGAHARAPASRPRSSRSRRSCRSRTGSGPRARCGRRSSIR